MEERDNAIRILRETKVALKKDDSMKLKDLSNQTIHTASITQDLDNIALAVVIYSLSKIIESSDLKSKPNFEKIISKCHSAIDNTIEAIKRNDDKKIHEGLESIRKSLEISSSIKKNVENVFMKAKINKASKIYEHGISMEKTADLLGITMYDLAGYIGQRDYSSDNKIERKLCETCDIKSRVKFAMELFS